MNIIYKQLKFDTVKLVTNSSYLSNINDELFEHKVDPSTGEVISVEFKSGKYTNIVPYTLYIRANYQSHRMTIEFSSKILLRDYPLLICAQTFRQCLLNIVSLGLCELDIDGIIKDCYFSKLHITKDIDLKLTPEILNRLNQCTGDYRRYKWQRYNDGIQFIKDVKAEDCKAVMTLYDKEAEIALPKNKQFLNKTGSAESILNYFQGKTRLEIQLDNKRRIMKDLGIANTDYHSVMTSQTNVSLIQFDKIFGSDAPESGTTQINNIVDYGLWCIIRYHDFDLKSIEQEIKDIKLYEDKTKGAMGKQMKKMKAMIDTYHSQDKSCVIEQIRSKLVEL